MSDPQRPEPGTAVAAPSRKLNLDQVVAAKGMGGGVTFLPRTMQECLDFATIMSKSDFAIPPKFRGNPGACLAVTIQSCRWEADPFGVIQKAYITKSKDGSERLAYEAQLVAAVVNTRAPLVGRLKLTYSGQGASRMLKVVGTFSDDPEPKELETPPISRINPKNSPLWVSDPDQQLAYYGQRAWGRRWCPEVLLGIYTPEELESEPLVDAPRPVRQVEAQAEKADEGIVRAAEPEPERVSEDVIAQAEALEPKPEDIVQDIVETVSAPISQGEAERLDDMRDPPVDDAPKTRAEADAGARAAFNPGEEEIDAAEELKEWEEYLARAVEGLQSSDLSSEKDLDDYAAATKAAIKAAEALDEDVKDDLRARFVSAFLNAKRERGFGRRR